MLLESFARYASSHTKSRRFLYRIAPCHRFRVPKVVPFITLAALSMLGACCLTTLGGGDMHCESGGSRNPMCYRRPNIDLPLTWLSVAICEKGPLLNVALSYSHPLALVGIVSSLFVHPYDDAAHAWFRPDNDANGGPHHLPQPTVWNSLEQVKIQKHSNGNDPKQNRGEVPTRPSPPSYRSSPTLLSSLVLPSIPLRQRDMNKLGLTVITDIPIDSSSGPPRKRWRGRGRDVWERKPLAAFANPQHK